MFRKEWSFFRNTRIIWNYNIFFSGACNISVHALAATSSEICTRQRCKIYEWLVRFSDDVKARPRELSVVKRIIVPEKILQSLILSGIETRSAWSNCRESIDSATEKDILKSPLIVYCDIRAVGDFYWFEENFEKTWRSRVVSISEN